MFVLFRVISWNRPEAKLGTTQDIPIYQQGC